MRCSGRATVRRRAATEKEERRRKGAARGGQRWELEGGRGAGLGVLLEEVEEVGVWGIGRRGAAGAAREALLLAVWRAMRGVLSTGGATRL